MPITAWELLRLSQIYRVHNVLYSLTTSRDLAIFSCIKIPLTTSCLNPFHPLKLRGVKIVAVPLFHSKPTHGYMIVTCKGVVAYLTDCESIPEVSLAYLKTQNIDHLFLDAAYTLWFESKKHLNWESAGAYIDEISPKKGYLIHASCKTLLPLHVKKIRLKYPYIKKGFSIEV